MIAEFTEIYDNRHDLARKWKQEGKFDKIVGYTYSFMPEELIYAAGALPVQLTESEERGPHSTGSIYIPDFFCDWCQSIVGQGIEGIYDYLDRVIFSNTCVPIRIAADVWDLEVNIPFRMITHPVVANEPAKRFVKVEFQRVKDDLEKLCETMITDDALRQAIDVYNENRRLIRDLYDLRNQDVPPVSGSSVFEIMKAGLVMPKDMHNEMLKKVLAELSEAKPKEQPKPRIMISSFVFEESVTTRTNFVRVVEDKGCDVVSDDLPWSPRYWWQEMKLDGEDLMKALVDHYVGKIPIAYKVSPEYRAKLVVEEAIKSRVKGAIFFIPMFCEHYLLQQPYIENSLQEKGIHTLTIETVNSMEEGGAVDTRIEAFIESLH
ncbi:2-hydroxyacyl-CoA dehydratase subunit D [Thermodesulfobacteriota bacterium]